MWFLKLVALTPAYFICAWHDLHKWFWIPVLPRRVWHHIPLIHTIWIHVSHTYTHFELEDDQYIGRPIYGVNICHFFIYRQISVFSSADFKSGTFAGSPVLLMLWTCCCCMWKTPSQNFWKIQQQSWEIKTRLKFWYFKVLWPYIYYILLVNYEVLLHLVKEKTNSIEPSGTGIMLQLVESSLTCS